MPQITINYLAVLVVAIISMVIGGLWFSPMLFGKQWMALSGMTDAHMAEAKNKGLTKAYLLQFVASLIMSYVLAHVIGYAGATTVSAGLQGGFWVWLGFIAPVTLGSVLWEGKSWKLWVLSNGHYLIVLLIAGAVLSVWR